LLDVGNLTNFNRLNNLHLSHNPQLHIDGDLFAGLANMRELFISAMDLHRLAGNFSMLAPLQKLRYLDLDGNHLDSLDLQKFPRLSALRTLSLDNNDMSSVEFTNLTNDFPALAYIYISRNKWNCSYLEQMAAHLNASGIKIYVKERYSSVSWCVTTDEANWPWAIIIVVGVLVFAVTTAMIMYCVCCTKRGEDIYADELVDTNRYATVRDKSKSGKVMYVNGASVLIETYETKFEDDVVGYEMVE
jgi:Leucine rich repeat